MLICDFLRALALASLPFAWWLGHLALAHVYLVALVSGVAFVFYNIAEIACLPQIVPAAQLPQAVSVNTAVESTGELLAPAIGGSLVGLGKTNIVGAMVAYVVQSAILGVSLIFLSGISTELKVETGAQSADNLVREMKDGFLWLIRHREIRALALLAMATSLLWSPVDLALIVLAQRSYHASPAAIGLFFTTCSVAGLIANFASPWLLRRFGAGKTIVATPVLWAVFMPLLPLSRSLIAMGLGWALILMTTGLGSAAGSCRLRLIPTEMQGRVNSVFRFIAWGVRPAMLALGGASIAALGARETLWLLAFGMILTALAAYFSLLRRLQ
jgi:Na+/melibiose symporter-like transporter